MKDVGPSSEGTETRFVKKEKIKRKEEDEEADDMIESVLDCTACKIQQGLYIGSWLAEQNEANLRSCNITHVLQVGRGLEPSHADTFEYLSIPLCDVESEDAVKHFPDAFRFMDDGITKGGVLVHCMAGVSRSATFCLGYLMWKASMPYEEAWSIVHHARPWISPNDGFRRQLREFERLQCDPARWVPWQDSSLCQQLLESSDSLLDGLREFERAQEQRYETLL